VTICPCCGYKFSGTLRDGCQGCGARSVGEALPKPQHVLPSYGRALVLAVSGALVVMVFMIETILAMIPRLSISLGFWSWIAAGETAAWRLKWIAIPSLFIVLWFGRKILRSIARAPERFCGIRYARRGLLASAGVALLFATLIGITVPARMRHREWAIEADAQGRLRAFELACFEYKQRHGRMPEPDTLKEDLSTVPDPDGTIAAMLRNLDINGYKPSADVASNGKQKSPALRGAVIRKISMNSPTDDLPSQGLSYTNYEMRLPGPDGILNTDDDWVGRDGVILRASDLAKGGVGRTASAGALRP
jgi:hypothetical protein